MISGTLAAGGKVVIRKREPPSLGTNVVIAPVGSSLPGTAVML